MTHGEPSLDDLDLRHHEVLAELRRRGPVVWVPALGGWVVTGRDLAVAVMRDSATFTVDDPRFSTAQVVGPSMLSLDGAAHQRHRAPFAEALRPAEVTGRYGPAIRALAAERVAALAPRGHAELRRELAGPLAVAVSAMVLGIDQVPPADLLALYDRIVAAVDAVSRGGDIGAGAAAVDALRAHLDAVMGDATTLVGHAASVLSPAEAAANAMVFLFGGIETCEGMTTNVLHHLLVEPGQWAAVVADPGLADAAVEESLRLEPAAARVDRYATRDVVLAGATIARGDLVVVSLAGANRDPEAFADPDRFDLHRADARTHLAFAAGPHACLGAQLARLQARAAVVALAAAMPAMRRSGATDPRGVIFRKPADLRVTWTM